MDLTSKLWDRALKERKNIVLPEGEEDRIIIASSEILKKGAASIILIGNRSIIMQKAKQLMVDISEVVVIDPVEHDKRNLYAKELFVLRKDKGLTLEEAQQLILKNVYFATMMVKMGDADGLVGGAVHTTSDLLRPALQLIKTAPGASLVSTFFVMVVPNSSYGENGLFLFADCGLIQNPDAKQLSSIAIQTAESAKKICEIQPRVALLSFSTKGSASDESVNKIIRALELTKENDPDLMIDGELQLDAAIVPEIGASKAPGSVVAGRANVLVFPDLNAGNIGYKLVERLAQAQAIGPICQGLAKPVNDLSRGSSVEDIVRVILVTIAQAQDNK